MHCWPPCVGRRNWIEQLTFSLSKEVWTGQQSGQQCLEIGQGKTGECGDTEIR